MTSTRYPMDELQALSNEDLAEVLITEYEQDLTVRPHIGRLLLVAATRLQLTAEEASASAWWSEGRPQVDQIRKAKS